MPAVAEAAQAVVEAVQVGEQIGQDHDQPAVADLPGDLGQDGRQVGLAVGLGRLQRVDDFGQLGQRGGRPQVGPLVAVEDGQADRVPLLDQQRGERGGDGGGVGELGHRAAAVGHAGAGVEDDGAAEVGLLLVAFDGVPVGPGEGPPVEPFEVVAGGVLAVVGELDGEAVERAAVQAGDAALDDPLGAEAQRDDLGEDGGVKRGHGGWQTSGVGGEAGPRGVVVRVCDGAGDIGVGVEPDFPAAVGPGRGVSTALRARRLTGENGVEALLAKATGRTALE